MSELAIQTRIDKDVCIISFKGELTSQDADAVNRTYPWLHAEPTAQRVLFDMTNLSYVNSGGIALLIRFVREARHRGIESFAYGVSAHYQRIFRIVGLTGYMELFPDEYSALTTLQSRGNA